MSHDAFSALSPLFPQVPLAVYDLRVREANGRYRAARPEELLHSAQQLLRQGLRSGPLFDAPQAVRAFLSLRLGTLPLEVFALLLLNAGHRLIEYRELFRGTLKQTSVYLREVVPECLMRRAAAVVLVHNYPSGNPQPSRADEVLTQSLKAALALIDVRVLDHMIVAGENVASMAELGRL